MQIVELSKTVDDTRVEKKAYSIAETCQALGVSRMTVFGLISGGRLRTVMVGKRRLIPATELDRLLSE